MTVQLNCSRRSKQLHSLHKATELGGSMKVWQTGGKVL